ncbi:MAG: amidohydrolase family protein [Microbacteriaceae bacterium]
MNTTPDQPARVELSELLLAEWAPRSQLQLPATDVSRPKISAIDIHNHLGRWLNDGQWMIDDVAALIDVMDGCGIDTMVNLDGLWGEEVSANVERYDRAYPGRFITFCQLDWSLLATPNGVADLCASLEDSRARGAHGVKVWKSLGLTDRDADGTLLVPDDPRVIAILAHAGELGMPVLIHTADPKAFFEPLDRHNERIDELLESPDWWFGDRTMHPTFARLLDALAKLVTSCPGTMFIGAHAGCAAEDLDLVERMLDMAPNYTIDIAGRMGELGRQPRRFRELLTRHPDRVLFGTDTYPPSAEQFRLHFRFLETSDEAFEYAPGDDIPPQGRWTVSALNLDDNTLRLLYRDNARRVLRLGIES